MTRAFTKSGSNEVFKLRHDDEILVRDNRAVYTLDARADVANESQTTRRYVAALNGVQHRADLTFLNDDPAVAVVLQRYNVDLHVWDVVETFLLIPRARKKRFCPQCGACVE